MVSFDFAGSIRRRHDDGWSAHNTLLIDGPIKQRQNASSPIATVKLYPGFAGVCNRPHDRQLDGKNLSPLFRFCASDTPLDGFKPLRPQLNRFMSLLGVIASIMIESVRIRHFKSLTGLSRIVCLIAYSAPITHALDPHCDFPLEQHLFWPKN